MSRKSLLIFGVLLLCVVLGAVPYATHVYGSDAETSITACVGVKSPLGESYGASVFASYRCLFAEAALGEQDDDGAVIWHGGWIGIELEETAIGNCTEIASTGSRAGDMVTGNCTVDMVIGCNEVSIWAAKVGCGSPRFSVYVSADGANWTEVGSVSCSSSPWWPLCYARYDFNGDFGDVKYVKVSRGGPLWSWLLLDAARAKSQVGERSRSIG